MAPALFLIGLAQGVGLPTLIRTVLERVDHQWAGLSAGLVNTMLQISGSLSVALVGGLFYSVLGDHTDSASITVAFASAMAAIGIALLIGAWLIDGVKPVAGASEPAFGEEAEFVAGH
jgi:sugar phosphate permease